MNNITSVFIIVIGKIRKLIKDGITTENNFRIHTRFGIRI
jgi:hypothetical protein